MTRSQRNAYIAALTEKRPEIRQALNDALDATFRYGQTQRPMEIPLLRVRNKAFCLIGKMIVDYEARMAALTKDTPAHVASRSQIRPDHA